MLAASRLLDPNLADCSNSELEVRFLGLLSAIKTRYSSFGIFLENPSKGVVAQFHSLESAAKADVLAQLRTVYQVSHDPEIAPPTKDNPANQFGLREEIASIHSFLKHQGLKLADDDFLTKIRDGAIVEMYNCDHRQIYRSWSFFSYCSYSLADILVYDWNTLYARPAWVVSRCFTDICDVLEGRRRMVKMEMPEFLLKENFSNGRHSILLKVRFVTALLDQSSGECRGYVCTQKGTLISGLSSDEKISFI